MKEQYDKLKEIQKSKWHEKIKFMPYLQAGTNTYKDVETLKEIYDEALNLDDDLFGLSIATRADELDDKKLELLSSINKKNHLQIELGFQSANESTNLFINRCLTNKEFEDAVYKLHKENIEIVVHIINGLPYEEENDMLNTIKYLNKLPINGIKIHSLLILKDAKLYEIYKEKPFKLLTLDEYVEITSKQISLLKDDIIIHRLGADAPSDDYLPLWPRKKMILMNEIDKYMRKNNLYQGKYFEKY